MKQSKKKVLILGPVPPPFGGVSIHIKRLTNLLKEDFDFDFIDESREKKIEYKNLRAKNFLFYFKKVKNCDILYIHSGKNLLRLSHVIVGKIFKKKVLLTIHSYPKKVSGIVRYLLSQVFMMANTVIIVNPETKKRLLLPDKKYVLKDAFIPPDIKSELELPNYISHWLLKNKENDIPIVCANASNMETHDGVDLYGLDLCIEVSKRLTEKGIPVKFIFVIASTHKNPHKYFQYQQLIKELNLVENFLLIKEKLSFIKIIQLSDIVLRPTNTDGDAVTIREGLFYNKLVLASDIVKRPEKVFLFKNRNIDDLELQLKYLIKLKKTMTGTIDFSEYAEPLNDLKEFYSQLIKNTFPKEL